MVLMQIVVFKCKVNVCDQDLGAFCREWDPETKERFCGQLLATKLVVEEVLEALMEVKDEMGVVPWASWVVLVAVGSEQWLAQLQSLLGWLWWHWIVLLGGALWFLLGAFVCRWRRSRRWKPSSN